jgi:predicted nucleic acid-binding protein
VRALADREPRAIAWLSALEGPRIRALAPDLFFAELGNAFLGSVRAGRLLLQEAEIALELGCSLPLEVTSLAELSPTAFRVAADRRLTVYDACYAVLAEAEDALLVTADGPLAAAVARSELV